MLKIFKKLFSCRFIAFALVGFLKKSSTFSMTGICDLQLFLFLTKFYTFRFCFLCYSFQALFCVIWSLRFSPLLTLHSMYVLQMWNSSMLICFYIWHYSIEFTTNLFQIYWAHLFFSRKRDSVKFKEDYIAYRMWSWRSSSTTHQIYLNRVKKIIWYILKI